MCSQPTALAQRLQVQVRRACLSRSLLLSCQHISSLLTCANLHEMGLQAANAPCTQHDASQRS